jgi:hypothetical protein
MVIGITFVSESVTAAVHIGAKTIPPAPPPPPPEIPPPVPAPPPPTTNNAAVKLYNLTGHVPLDLALN